MPIYEYQCSACGQRMEKLQKHSDPPFVDCPACGKAALSKLISPTAFRLKGSGWYETDFKTGKKRNLIGDPTGGAAGVGGSGGESAASSDVASTSAKSGTDDRKNVSAPSKSSDN